jgi:hypothetical protein
MGWLAGCLPVGLCVVCVVVCVVCVVWWLVVVVFLE